MVKFYSDELVEEIRLKNDIVDVVSEYVKLEKKGGRYLFGICPFHKEKTASFAVTPSKQIFYCYSCGKGGNVFHFIANIENLSYGDAIRYLADRAKILLTEEESEEGKERARQRKAIIDVNTCAARFFYDNLSDKKKNCIANKYLASRGLNSEIINKFGIGYSLDEWDSLYKHLLDKGFEQADIIKSGLVIQNKNKLYDRFRNRLMFPIFDVRGNVIAFGGRSIDSSMPKYINSPETLVYIKGKNLYGLNIAKKYSQNSLIIVEGYMDAISLYQYGIPNVVASLGTALTESQGFLLKKYTKEIIIAYDSDVAGQAATLRGLDILNNIGCNVKVISVPDGKDPDEYVRKHGKDKLEAVIKNAASLLEYKIQILKGSIDVSTTEGKIEFLEKTAKVLADIENSIELELYIKKIAEEYEISEDSLLREVAKKKKPGKNLKLSNMHTKNLKPQNRQNQDNADYYEKLILVLLCEDNNLFKIVKEKLDLTAFTSEDNKKIANILFNKLHNKEGVVIGELFSLINENIANTFSKIIQEDCNFEDKEKALLDIIKKIEINKLSIREKEIIQLLNNKTDSGNEFISLKQELSSILIKKKQYR